MSTLAELLIKINGDSQGLSKELQKTKSDINSAFSVNPVAEMAGAITSATNNLGSFAGKLGSISALAAGGFGLGKIVESAVASGEALYQLSNRFGLSTAEASQLNKVLKLTGGDVDSFASVMTRLDKSYMGTGKSGEKVREILDVFGVSLTDSSGKLLPLNQQLAALSKGYKLASTNGMEQEFIMSTLGAKGLVLAKTLQDYDEAAQRASMVKGVGIDPQKMHELNQQIKVASMQANSLGTAFAGALTPVALELFPPLTNGLIEAAALISENKELISGTAEEVLKVTLAYKGLSTVNSAVLSIGNAWRDAATKAAEAAAAQGGSARILSMQQQAAISQAVAASGQAYAKMEKDAVKAARQSALSAEEAAAVMREKSIQIAGDSAATATAIRNEMTAAFLANNAASTESTALQMANNSKLTADQERQISARIAASNRAAAQIQADAIKTAITVSSSAEEAQAAIVQKCLLIQAEATAAAEQIRVGMTAAFLGSAESSKVATASITEDFAVQGAAATAAGEKTVVSSAMAKEALITQNIVQKELTASVVASGDAAVVMGERTVGAMAVAKVGAGNFLSSLLALAGGWLGVAAATAIAIDALMDYLSAKQRVRSYNPKAEVRNDPDRPGEYLVKRVIPGEWVVDPNSIAGAYYMPEHEGFGPATDAEKEEHQLWETWDEKNQNDKPWRKKITDPSLLEGFQNSLGSGESHGGGGGGGGHSGMDKLTTQALNVHNAIRKEWISTTKGRVDQADEWYKTELEELNKSASANEEYEKDLQKLNEIYARKRTQALYEEQKEKNSINDSMYDSARSLQERMSKLSLPMMTNSSGGMEPSKVAADLQNVQNEYDAAITKIQNKYRDLEGTYEAASAREQAIYRDAWAKNGIDFQTNEQGKVNFKKQIDKESVVSEQEKDQKIRAINVARKQWEEAQESARNAGNIAAFQATLSNEQALLAQDLAGRQAMIDVYYETWKETHRTSMSYMAELMGGTKNGFKSFFSDMFTGTKSISDAWSGLGQTIGNVIANMAAEWLAAQVAMAIFGKSGLTSSAAQATAGGAAVAAAWAPAAAMVSLATFGENSGPAMGGIALTTGFAEALSTTGMATGGMVFGPGTGTSDSIPTWLSAGEFVFTAAATKAWGADNLAAMNAGHMPKFASGGIVAGPSVASLGSGSIRTASFPTLETKDAGSASGQMNMPPINIVAWDGKSVKSWLDNGGIDMIMGRASRVNKKNPYGKR